MSPNTRHPFRRIAIALVSTLAAVALTVVIGVWRPWAAPHEAPVAQAPAPVHIDGPADAPHVLVFGDSWTYGMAASEPALGYAQRLAELGGWRVTVNGEPGSGYLKPGWWGTTYGGRIARLDPALDPDVVVVQGSINDRRLPAAGYPEAAAGAWDALAESYPDATFLVIGPAPQVLPVERETARIDHDLAELAAQRGWAYLSPIAEEWITDENYLDVIDTSDLGKNHPSDAGHLLLAEKVTAAVHAVLPPLTVEAGDEAPLPASEG